MISDDSSKAILVSLLVIVLVWSINGVYLSALSHYSIAAFWIVDILQWIVLPAGILWFLITRKEIRPSDFGLEKLSINPKFIILTGLVTLTLYPSFFVVRNYTWLLLGQPSGFFAFPNVFPEGFAGTVTWIYSAITAGVIESIFFIGLPWLLWSYRRIGNAISFALVSSTIFAAAHWEQGLHTVIGALTFGLVACAWYFRLKTLWPIIIGHTIIDLVAFG